MSNRLLNAAKAITSINGRKIHPSEKLVLLALADDARDYLGGRTEKLIINRQLQEITGLSERAVRMAISALIADGHISRQPGKPGAAMETLVHPGRPVAPEADIAPKPADIAAKPATIAGGPYSRENNNHTPSPEDRDARAREPAAPDEVDQLFNAWDAFLERAKLPGPVTRSPARRAAIRSRLAEYGQGRLMMAIDQAERGYRAGKFRRPGQGDLWLNIDRVFEVRPHDAAMGLLAELLDGQHAPPTPKANPSPAAPPPDRAGEGEAEREVRRLAKAAMGDHSYQAWLQYAALRIEGDTLWIRGASAFATDWLVNQLGNEIRRAASQATRGQAIRIRAMSAAPAPA